MNESSQSTMHLIPLPRLTTEQQFQLREVRNQPDVRRWMYTDHEISEAEHRDWLRRMINDSCHRMFAVVDLQGCVKGAASINQINVRHQTADWAYYLTQSLRGGWGAAMEMALIDFAFEQLALQKLNCEVLEGNDSVIRLHEKFGFQSEGFRRSQIWRANQRCGVHLLGLTVADWQRARPQIVARYGRILDQFIIRLYTESNEADKTC